MTEILDRWQHPGRAEDTLGKPGSAQGKERDAAADLGKAGEFVMEVSFYGYPPGWRVTTYS